MFNPSRSRLVWTLIPTAVLAAVLALVLFIPGMGSRPAAAAQISLTETMEVSVGGPVAGETSRALSPLVSGPPPEMPQISASHGGLPGAQNMYTVGYYQGYPYKIDPASGLVSPLPRLSPVRYWRNFRDNSPQDELGNAYFISYDGRVARVSAGGTIDYIASVPWGGRNAGWDFGPLVQDEAGNLFALSQNGYLAKITPNETGWTSTLHGVPVVVTGAREWVSLKVAADGNLFTLDHLGRIIKVPPQGGTQSLFADSRRDIYAGFWRNLEISADGTTLYALSYDGSGYVARIPTTGSPTLLARLGIRSYGWESLELDAEGRLYALTQFGHLARVEGGRGVLIRYLPSLTNWTWLGWFTMVASSDKMIYLLQERGYVIAFNPTTGGFHRIVSPGQFPFSFRRYFNLSLPTGSADKDNDELPKPEDNCPVIWNPGQGDVDGDTRGNVCDNLPENPNVDKDSMLLEITQGAADFGRREFRAVDGRDFVYHAGPV